MGRLLASGSQPGRSEGSQTHVRAPSDAGWRVSLRDTGLAALRHRMGFLPHRSEGIYLRAA